jgi:transposase
MSLHPEAIGPVPEATARAARASFPKGTACLRLRDKLGAIFDDEMFAGLYPKSGQPGYAPWRLALVTVLQFAEGLSDRQAADAVRGRLDWKYALGLELDDPGFDASILCEFRSRLLGGGQEYLLLDALVGAARGCGLIRLHGQQRTDATHVLAAVRTLHRLELVGESLRAALNAVAAAAPAWLAEHLAPPPVAAAWVERYGARVEAFRLPAGKAARAALAETIGDDGQTLLAALWSPSAPSDLRGLPAVERLRRIWVQQYYVVETEGKARQVRWRDPAEQPPAAQRLASPYDAEARVADKRSVQWLGYKVHLTETCEPEEPLLVVAVETTPAPQPDRAALTPILNRLAARDLLPATQLVDTGYVDAAALVAARDCYGVELVGPAMPDVSRQGRAKQGYDLASFVVDWAAQRVVCPAGQASAAWTASRERHGRPVAHVRFDTATCRACRDRPACTGAKSTPRHVRLPAQAEHEALQARRREQETEPWKKRYAARAGIEGTISQAVRGAFGLRRSRYLGLAKNRLQHLATAAAINWVRLSDWFNQRPRAKTRRSHLVAALQSQAAA